MINFLKGELQGWKKGEVFWLLFSTLVILAVSIYCKDSLISIFGALTGIWYTIFAGKGKRSAFLFGIINVFLYSYISFKVHYYGEVMLNALYFLPMHFIGFILWSKHINKETAEVEKKSMCLKHKLFMYIATAAGVFMYGSILKQLGGNLPYIDSLSTVVSVVAQVLAVKRLTEQWSLWTIVNGVTVIMWIASFINTGTGIAMIAMWAVYLITGIIMLERWNKEVNN